MRNLIASVVLSFSLICCINAHARENVAQPEKRVIVIDPGHGGVKYPGATYKGYKEKDINLQVALKLKSLLNKRLPSLDVVMTRSEDKQLDADKNADLRKRAAAANDRNAVFFISIHANAVDGNTSACGTETHILGEDERSKATNYHAIKRCSDEEAGELIDMSDETVAALERAIIESRQMVNGAYNRALANIIERNYAEAGMKSRGLRQSPWAVLRNITMPGVLTEIGYMSNARDLAFITSDKGQLSIAEAICKSVEEYIKLLDKLNAAQSTSSSQSDEQPESATQADAGEDIGSGYTIQLLSSSKKVSLYDREFKSYRNRVMMLNGRSAQRISYKYCFGRYSSKADAKRALKEVREEFPDAYIVEFDGDGIR